MLSYSDDVDKVVLAQCVQNGVDGVFGDGHLQTLHAAADVHHDNDVFRGRGCLDVPERNTTQRGHVFKRTCLFAWVKKIKNLIKVLCLWIH